MPILYRRVQQEEAKFIEKQNERRWEDREKEAS